MEATHTHTRRPEVGVNSSLTHPGSSLLQDPPGAVGSFSAPGDQLNRPSRSVTDRSVLFFLLARLHRNQSLKLTIQHLDFYQYSSLVDKLPCLSSIMGVRYATSKIFVVLLHWLLALYVRPYFNHVFFV